MSKINWRYSDGIQPPVQLMSVHTIDYNPDDGVLQSLHQLIYKPIVKTVNAKLTFLYICGRALPERVGKLSESQMQLKREMPGPKL